MNPLVPSLMLAGAVPLLKDLFGRVKKTAANGIVRTDINPLQSGNLLAATKAARVEPITLIDQRLVNDQELGQVLQGLLGFFAATYLQAVSLITPVGKINPRRVLDTLNPERSLKGASHNFFNDMYSNESFFSAEAFKYALPSMENASLTSHTAGDHVKDLNAGLHAGIGHLNVRSASTIKADDLNESLSKNVNLSVGRIYDVELSNGDAKKVIPVSFRLISTVLPSNVMAHILGDGSHSNSAKETWHDWRGKGGTFKGFWSDVVLAKELVSEHRKALMADSSGTYQTILDRRRNNFYSSLLTKDPSLNNAANLIVISKETAKDLESKIGRLDDYRTRQRVFDSSYAMVIVVMDSAWNRVTYYHNGIKLPTTLSFAELKGANKGQGIDVEQILKAYQFGSAVV